MGTGADTDESYAPFAARWIEHIQTFATSFAAGYSDQPEPGSTADLELNHSTESGPGGLWPRDDRSRPYEITGGLIPVAVAHQLASLQMPFTSEMKLFGFQSIPRSLVEACARASWVLDPDIDIRQRVIRASLLQLESIQEAKLVELAAGQDGSHYHQRISDLKIRTALLGIDEKLGKQGQLRGFEGQTLPGKMDSVKLYLALLGMEKGEMWYRSMSGVSHSVLYGVTEYLQADPSATDTTTGKTKPMPKLPIHAVANSAVLSIDSYLFVVQRHAALYGRDAGRVAGQRLIAEGELLSAINRPELRYEPPRAP